MNLSEKETKYLLQLEKNKKASFLNYIGVGFLFCMTIYGLVVGIGFNKEGGFFTAIFCGFLGINLFIVTRVYEKHYLIIKKMKEYIQELEAGKNRE